MIITTTSTLENRPVRDYLGLVGGEVIETSEDILAKITGKDNPQAVAGVFTEFDTGLEALDRDAAPIWLVAQALRDPGNLGTMLRTGDAHDLYSSYGWRPLSDPDTWMSRPGRTVPEGPAVPSSRHDSHL